MSHLHSGSGIWSFHSGENVTILFETYLKWNHMVFVSVNFQFLLKTPVVWINSTSLTNDRPCGPKCRWTQTMKLWYEHGHWAATSSESFGHFRSGILLRSQFRQTQIESRKGISVISRLACEPRHGHTGDNKHTHTRLHSITNSRGRWYLLRIDNSGTAANSFCDSVVQRCTRFFLTKVVRTTVTITILMQTNWNSRGIRSCYYCRTNVVRRFALQCNKFDLHRRTQILYLLSN